MTRLLRGGDAVDPVQLPAGLDVYWGYPDGRWQDYLEIAAAHPAPAAVFSTVVTAADDGDELDIETGDAIDDQAPGWWARQRARGLARPGFYRQVSGVASLMLRLGAANIPRAAYRLRTAHYDPRLGPHICSPVCWPGLWTTADATQWVDHGGWDESLCYPSILKEPLMTDLARPVCCIVNRPQNDGYWLVMQDGGVANFGAAPNLGSEASVNLQPGHLIVDATCTPSGAGLFLAGSDGGVFALGDARYRGSIPAGGVGPSSQPLEA